MHSMAGNNDNISPNATCASLSSMTLKYTFPESLQNYKGLPFAWTVPLSPIQDSQSRKKLNYHLPTKWNLTTLTMNLLLGAYAIYSALRGSQQAADHDVKLHRRPLLIQFRDDHKIGAPHFAASTHRGSILSPVA